MFKKKFLQLYCPICGNPINFEFNEIKNYHKFNEEIASIIEGNDLKCNNCKKESIITIDWHNLKPELRAI